MSFPIIPPLSIESQFELCVIEQETKKMSREQIECFLVNLAQTYYLTRNALNAFAAEMATGGRPIPPLNMQVDPTLWRNYLQRCKEMGITKQEGLEIALALFVGVGHAIKE